MRYAHKVMACLEIDSKGIPKTFQACFEWWQSYWNKYDTKSRWAFASDVSEFQTQIWHFLVLESWKFYVTSPRLSFLMHSVIYTSQIFFPLKVNWDNTAKKFRNDASNRAGAWNIFVLMTLKFLHYQSSNRIRKQGYKKERGDVNF